MKIPTLEYLTRPIKVSGKKVTTTELAILGRIVIVAVSQGVKVDKKFIQEFVDEKILIYTNPENVDFSEYKEIQ